MEESTATIMAYARLVHNIADMGDLPADLSNESRLLRMIARGLGSDEVPAERHYLLIEIVTSEACIPALPYELAFPEVFFPRGELGFRAGFDVGARKPPMGPYWFRRTRSSLRV